MIRKTHQREVIKEVFIDCKRALSVAEIHEEAMKSHSSLGIATVYRTVKSLLESGEIVPVEIGGDVPRYELAHLGHHHHFKCSKCDKVFDIHGCVNHFGTLLPKGFRLHSHEITFFGTCAQCS